MVTMDPFDLVRRLRHAPLEPLVEALRRVHERGTVSDKDFWPLINAAVPAPPPETRSTAGGQVTPDYEAAREHFVRHSERLREQALLAERLLDGLTRLNRSETVSLREELRARGLPGTTACTHFIVANRLSRAADVAFRVGPIHHAAPAISASVRTVFTPDRPRLEPGDERTVELSIALPDIPGLPDPLEFGVDVLSGEQLMTKLWVRVDLSAEAVNE